MKKKLLIIGTILLNISLLAACGNIKVEEEIPIANTEPIEYIEETVEEDKLKVYFFDVGQADSSLVVFPNEKTMLIDAGNNEDGEKLVSTISEMGISKIDYLIGTHPHEDHIGGLDDIIENFEIGNIYMPNVTSDTKTFEEVVEAIENKNLKITEPIPGMNIYSDFDTKATILAPNSSKYDNLNNYSIVVKLTYKNTSFLFQGDAESIVEKEILDTGIDIDVDVLKVGHHGSSSSSTKAYLLATTPKIAIISVGTENSYGHPHKETLDIFNKNNIETYRTDLYGTISIITDGNTLNIAYDGNASAPPIIDRSNTIHYSNGTQIEGMKPYSVLEDRVYITPTGEKYHKEDCYTIEGDFSVLTETEAIENGYTPCGICWKD